MRCRAWRGDMIRMGYNNSTRGKVFLSSGEGAAAFTVLFGLSPWHFLGVGYHGPGSWARSFRDTMLTADVRT